MRSKNWINRSKLTSKIFFYKLLHAEKSKKKVLAIVKVNPISDTIISII